MLCLNDDVADEALEENPESPPPVVEVVKIPATDGQGELSSDDSEEGVKRASR